MYILSMGFSSDMVNMISYNTGLLKNRTYFDVAEEYRSEQKRKGLTYKTATPEQLKQLKDELREDRKRQQIKQLAILVFSFLVVIIVAIWTINIISSAFLEPA
jgi:preprotein translocase subunit SecE